MSGSRNRFAFGHHGLSLLLLVSLLVSCAKPEFTNRVAVLRFENLAQDPSEDWIGRAVSEEIAGQLEGTRHHAVISFETLRRMVDSSGSRPLVTPGVSAERDAAISAGADRLVEGYYSMREGRLRLTALEENLSTGRLGAPMIVEGPVDDLLHLTDQIAKTIDIEARPAITNSARALRSYAIALESPPEQARALFEESARLDPEFGSPWVALAHQSLAKDDKEAFAKIHETVRNRGSIRALDRAILNLDDARLKQAPGPLIDALYAIVRITPADPFRLQELARTELENGRFAEAVDHYRKLIQLLPSSSDVSNEFGYALMYIGDSAAAEHALENYRQARPDEANPLDSIGDCHFFFGRFDQAERAYLEAYQKDASFLNGGDLLKAAWSRLMRSDRAGALDLVRRYRSERSSFNDSLNDSLADYRAAQILHLAGQTAVAEQLVSAYTESQDDQLRTSARNQLAWWLFFDGRGPAPEATSKLDRALLLLGRKEFEAAYPLWRELAEQASPTDWWIRTVYARVLLETGQLMESERYRRFNPIPEPDRAITHDQLWYPWLLEIRATRTK